MPPTPPQPCLSLLAAGAGDKVWVLGGGTTLPYSFSFRWCHGLDTQRAGKAKYVLRHAHAHTGVHAVFQPLSIENCIFEFILRTPVLF